MSGVVVPSSGGVSLPIAESDVTNLVTDLAAKGPLPVSPYDPSQNGYLAQSMINDAASEASTANLTSQRIYAMRCVVRAAAASGARSVVYGINSAGATLTSGQNLLAVYSSTGALLGTVTADQTTNFGTNGIYTASVGTFAVALGDVIYICVLSVGTTPPKFYGTGANPVGILNYNLSAASLRFSVQASGQTAMPASITPASLVNTTPMGVWVALI